MPTPPSSVAPSPEALAWSAAAGWAPDDVEGLAGDVSPRRYFRLRRAAGDSAILATYPGDQLAACHRFGIAADLLEEAGLRVPRRLASDCERGLMLLEDLGPKTLFERRDRGWEYLGPRLRRAAEVATSISDLPAERVTRLNPPLDRSLLAGEIESTWRLALGTVDLVEAGLGEALDEALATMLDAIDEVPRLPCHRDLMARNLMPVDGELVLLDFQDLRLGPRGYDLASLLNDSLYAPEELERAVLDRHLPSEAERLAYHRLAAQRTLKIAGTFLGFARRGVARHLPLVAPSVERAGLHLGRLPEMEGLEEPIEALRRALVAAATP